MVMNERGLRLQMKIRLYLAFLNWYLLKIYSSCSLKETHHKNISHMAKKLGKGVERGYYLRTWLRDDIPSSWTTKMASYLSQSSSPTQKFKIWNSWVNRKGFTHTFHLRWGTNSSPSITWINRAPTPKKMG